MKKTSMIRVFLLVLCAYCAQIIYSEYCIVEGNRQYRAQAYGQALHSYEKSISHFDHNSLVYKQLLKTLYQLSLRNTQENVLAKMFKYSRQWSNKSPSDAYGWFWFGYSDLRLKSEAGILDEEAWAQIENSFSHAVSLDPVNEWILFQIGQAYLLYGNSSKKTKEKAFYYFRKLIAHDHPDKDHYYLSKPSPYLNSILSLVWKRYGQFEDLKTLTPKNYPSYKNLLDFLSAENLQQNYDSVFEEFLKLRMLRYQEIVKQGMDQLTRGDRNLAYRYFNKALWVTTWAQSEPKAGLLAAAGEDEEKIKQIEEMLKQSRVKILNDILKDESAELEALIPFLKPVVERVLDEEVSALWAFRTKNYLDVIRILENKERTCFLDYVLASSYSNLNEMDKVQSILDSYVVSEKTDARVLKLIVRAFPLKQASAHYVLEQIAGAHYLREKWWAQPKKSVEDEWVLRLNLLAGENQIKIFFKEEAIDEDNVIIVYLDEKPIGSFYVPEARKRGFFKKTIKVTPSGLHFLKLKAVKRIIGRKFQTANWVKIQHLETKKY